MLTCKKAKVKIILPHYHNLGSCFDNKLKFMIWRSNYFLIKLNFWQETEPCMYELCDLPPCLFSFRHVPRHACVFCMPNYCRPDRIPTKTK